MEHNCTTTSKSLPANIREHVHALNAEANTSMLVLNVFFPTHNSPVDVKNNNENRNGMVHVDNTCQMFPSENNDMVLMDLLFAVILFRCEEAKFTKKTKKWI